MKTKTKIFWNKTMSAIPNNIVEIPAGSKVEFNRELKEYFIDPSIFPQNSIDRHDATYYGCRVEKENIDFAED